MSYGYYTCPHCTTSFYGEGGGHDDDCPNTTQCVYHFGPKEFKKLKEYAEKYGENAAPPITSPIRFKDIRQKFPDLIVE